MTVETIKLVLALLSFGTAILSAVTFFLLPCGGTPKHSTPKYHTPRLRVVATQPDPLDKRAA